MSKYHYKNEYTGEVYCSANCALNASLEGAMEAMSPERFQEYVQNTSMWSPDLDNLNILNREVNDDDACGEVVICRDPLDSDAINLCDKCFKPIEMEV